jgi:WD40 repeat protein
VTISLFNVKTSQLKNNKIKNIFTSTPVNMQKTVEFKWEDCSSTYTEDWLRILLKSKLANNTGIPTNDTLFFGYRPGVYNVPSEPRDIFFAPNITNIDVVGVASAIQLRNQHNLLLVGNPTSLYNFKTYKLTKLAHLTRYTSRGRHVTQLDDDRVAILLGRNLCICDPFSLKITAEYETVSNVIGMVANNLLGLARDGPIELWDTNSMKCVRTLKGHDKNVTCILKLANGTAASSSFDTTIRVWNVLTGECLRVLQGHTDNVWGVVEHQNMLVSCSYDRTIRFWDVQSATCSLKVKGGCSGCYYSIIVKHDGTIYAIGSKTISYNRDTGVTQETAIADASCAVNLIYYPHIKDF